MGDFERWLIDRNGDSWRHGDPRLSRKLGTTLAGKELALFTVANMGYVSLEYSGTRLHVRCRPKRLGALTLASLYYFVVDHSWSPIALSLLLEQWSTRIFPQGCQVIDALARLVPADTCAAPKVLFENILSSPVAPERSPLLQTVRATLPVIEDTADIAAMNRLFRGRWSIGHFDADTHRFVFDHMGSAFTGSNLIETLWDSDYAAWVERSRHAALESNEPVFEAIDAVVTTSMGAERLRYHRVMRTFRGSGRSSIFSASVDDSSINFRKAV